MNNYFISDEFDDPTAPGSGSNMTEDLLRKLNMAREIAGIPFVIESGFRTAEHNTAVGGKPKSAHLTGEAVDIKVTSPQNRWRILTALLAAGFQRIELKPHDIHADVAHDPDHPVQVILFYDTKTGALV